MLGGEEGGLSPSSLLLSPLWRLREGMGGWRRFPARGMSQRCSEGIFLQVKWIISKSTWQPWKWAFSSEKNSPQRDSTFLWTKRWSSALGDSLIHEARPEEWPFLLGRSTWTNSSRGDQSVVKGYLEKAQLSAQVLCSLFYRHVLVHFLLKESTAQAGVVNK